MNSKVNIQTNKAKLGVCLRQSSILRLNLDVSLAGLSWPLFIGGYVSRNRSGSIQTCHIWQFTYQFHIEVHHNLNSILGLCFYGPLPEYTSGVPILQASVVIPLSVPPGFYLNWRFGSNLQSSNL
jgi:hypothetical protein